MNHDQRQRANLLLDSFAATLSSLDQELLELARDDRKCIPRSLTKRYRITAIAAHQQLIDVLGRAQAWLQAQGYRRSADFDL